MEKILNKIRFENQKDFNKTIFYSNLMILFLNKQNLSIVFSVISIIILSFSFLYGVVAIDEFLMDKKDDGREFSKIASLLNLVSFISLIIAFCFLIIK